MRHVHFDAVDQILERLPWQLEVADERLQALSLPGLRQVIVEQRPSSARH